jgi:hypothetical protein
MSVFRTVAGVTTCTSCAEVIDGTGWRPKAAHTCRGLSIASRVKYVEALAYADALARLHARTTTTPTEMEPS